MSTVMETASPPASPSVIDVEALLAPIPGDNPAGESLQYSGLYDEIREARRTEDTLAQGDWKRETKVADWSHVLSLATDALATQTKDLQICAWLTEALIKVYGFEGLRDGLKVMRGLHEIFWDHLYPEVDDGDLEARANSVSWMDRQAATALMEVPLTKSKEGIDYSYNQWKESNSFNITSNLDDAAANELRQRATSEGKITSEDWTKAKTSTRRAFYEEVNAVLNESWTAFEAIDRVMDEKFGRETPGLGALKKSLDELRTLISTVVKEKRLIEPDPVSVAVAVATDGGGQSGANIDGFAPTVGAIGTPVTGPVRTRQEALAKLAEVAHYFRQTEPHSPVSYLVERAIKWGQMSLDMWLASVIKDHTVLVSLRETLGVETATDGSTTPADSSTTSDESS